MKRYNHIFKVYLSSALGITLALVLSVLLIYYPLEKQYQQEHNKDFDAQLRILRHTIENQWAISNGNIQGLVKSIPLADNIRLTVVGADGKVLGDNQSDPMDMENHFTPERSELTQAMKGQLGDATRWSETIKRRLRYTALPIYQGEQIIGVVRLSQPVETPADNKEFVGQTAAWLPVVVLLSAGIATALIERFWYAPLRKITTAARAIADGNLDARTVTIGTNEMARMGRALNDMRDHLARQISRSNTQRDNLMQTVANLREGVLAIDAGDCIVLMNEAAMNIIHPDDARVQGKHLQAVVRYADIVDIYYETPAGGSPAGRQVTINYLGQTHHLEVYAHRFGTTGQDGIAGLIVLHDVTALVRTAAMKSEFVANASHELRTPVATLRAAVDSLQEGDGEHPRDRARLIDILHRQVGRLEEMTRDLLDLQIVENDRYRLQCEDVQLNSFIQTLAEPYAVRAEEKKLTFQLVPVNPSIILQTDRRLLSLIVQNLLDNAVKFTASGDTIICRLTREEDVVCISVEDTGCGIRPEDQKRVFERFYQADVSRSGDARIRGTGLGLAIVKHAAEQLGAQVQLQSTFGKGTIVELRLPLE
ncbi:MAG: HAMP domain-containing protein [Sedimentisphaerales bacterium]|nr:HAMP domain-containing protein [Sedimentisphaerales bacterium]